MRSTTRTPSRRSIRRSARSKRGRRRRRGGCCRRPTRCGRARCSASARKRRRATTFVSLLKVEPGYTLTGQVSPRIVAMFDEVVKANVTELRLAVVPADAEVLLDGDQDRRPPRSCRSPSAITRSARRASAIRSVTQPFTAVAGVATVVDSLALERVATVFRFVTAPAGVEVVIDGISHGRTQARSAAGRVRREGRAGRRDRGGTVGRADGHGSADRRASHPVQEGLLRAGRAPADGRSARRLRARSGEARACRGDGGRVVEPARHAGARSTACSAASRR